MRVSGIALAEATVAPRAAANGATVLIPFMIMIECFSVIRIWFSVQILEKSSVKSSVIACKQCQKSDCR